VAARCRQIRDHGRLNKDVHAEVGFNLRFNDIQARGRPRAPPPARRHERAAAAHRGALCRGLAGLPLGLPSERAGARHVYHLYVIRTTVETRWPSI
jgi:dTDP-4-amino-4,6-dideoxygalactose transaminase